jgi:hypothetical protein
MFSVVFAGNRNNTASLLMELYDLASKQGLVWIGTLYICESISLLAFSMYQCPVKAGLQHLSLCATVGIFRYAGCGPATPVDEAKPKTYCKYNDSVVSFAEDSP